MTKKTENKIKLILKLDCCQREFDFEEAPVNNDIAIRVVGSGDDGFILIRCYKCEKNRMLAVTRYPKSPDINEKGD